MNLVILFNSDKDNALMSKVQKELVAAGCRWKSGDTHLDTGMLQLHEAKLFQVVGDTLYWGHKVKEELFNGETYTTSTASEFMDGKAGEEVKAEPKQERGMIDRNMVIVCRGGYSEELFNRVQDILTENGFVWNSDLTELEYPAEGLEYIRACQGRLTYGEGDSTLCDWCFQGIKFETIPVSKFVAESEVDKLIRYLFPESSTEAAKEAVKEAAKEAAKEATETVFEKYLDAYFDVYAASGTPSDFDHVEHIGHDAAYGDVFKCWDEDPEEFTLYFGKKG